MSTKTPNLALFEEHKIVRVRSHFLGQRLDLKAFDTADSLATSPLVVRAGSAGYAVMFRYGVVVLFNLGPVEEISFLSALSVVVIDPLTAPETDFVDVMVDSSQPDKIAEKYVQMSKASVENVQLLADVLAKSTCLSYYENNIAQVVDRIEPMAEALRRKGRMTKNTKRLLQSIGESLLIQSKMAGTIQVGEKPDMLWERPDLERFYLQLEGEYELRERLTILRHKLELVHQTSETLLGLLQDKRSFHVEWYIVLLILFEIIMSLIEKFF